jgi:hypothetical protein
VTHVREARKETLSDIDRFLKQLCIEWGFCSQLTALELTIGLKALDAGLFADAVLRAERMVPADEEAWKHRLESKFIEQYGQFVALDVGDIA